MSEWLFWFGMGALEAFLICLCILFYWIGMKEVKQRE